MREKATMPGIPQASRCPMVHITKALRTFMTLDPRRDIHCPPSAQVSRGRTHAGLRPLPLLSRPGVEIQTGVPCNCIFFWKRPYVNLPMLCPLPLFSREGNARAGPLIAKQVPVLPRRKKKKTNTKYVVLKNTRRNGGTAAVGGTLKPEDEGDIPPLGLRARTCVAGVSSGL